MVWALHQSLCPPTWVAAMPFLAGPYAWLILERVRYPPPPPPAVLRYLTHAISSVLRPWRAPAPPGLSSRAQ